MYGQNCMRLFAKVLDEIALDTTDVVFGTG